MAKILVIDDEEYIRKLFRFALERVGHIVCEADCKDEALRVARDENPDLVLVDVVMQDAPQGFDFIRAVRSDRDPPFRDVPIILMSGTSTYAEPGSRLQNDPSPHVLGPRIEFHLFLRKPFGAAELLEAVARHLPEEA